MFQMIKDWSLVKKQKEGLLDALRQTPPGACISIKSPNDPVMARAIIEILKDNPNEIEAVDYGFEVTLMRKVGLAKSMTRDSYQALKDSYGILDANGVMALGLNKSHALPAHKFRNGVPNNVNGSETLSVDENKIIVEKP